MNPDRDQQGRFLPGNRLAAQGGRARAARLSPQRRREIASLGAQAAIAKYGVEGWRRICSQAGYKAQQGYRANYLAWCDHTYTS